MQGINLKVILLHSLVVLLAAHAFVALGYIFDTPLAELYLETGDLGKFEASAAMYEVDAGRIDKFVLVQQYAPFAGALFGVVLSFIAVRRKKLGLQNALIVLVIAALLAFAGVLNSPFLKGILFAPGRLASASVATAYTLNYLLLLGLSFWLAFSRRIIPASEQRREV